MAEGRRGRGKGGAWSDAELQAVRDNICLPLEEIAALLPGRSLCSVKNVFYRLKRDAVAELERRSAELAAERRESNAEQYAVKEPGDYIETLSAYFVNDWELMEIWARWNGYATWRELSRDMSVGAFGIVTLLCSAK